MLKRSDEFWIVAFFLSRYGESNGGHERAKPPAELGTEKWNQAYRMFYESIAGGRSVSSFEHSLKNARDAYDSHLGHSKRIGWRNKNKEPNNLNVRSKKILQVYSSKTRAEIWGMITPMASANLYVLETVFNDVSIMQDSEQNTDVVTRTEGGRKMISSFRYERKPSNRKDAFDLHGFDCAVCGFNFGKTYGSWGQGFAEVHHLIPFFETGSQHRQTNPQIDLAVVCSNCHRMMHRKKGMTLTVKELRNKLR